jgi:acyl carrier protein
VFREALSIEPLSPDTDMIESAWLDSLSLVTLVFELEECFSIEIPFENLDIDAFRTVQSITRVIEHQVQARSIDRACS